MPDRWLDAHAPEVRADVCEVQSTREETCLLFGTRVGAEHANLLRRIILTPVMAKRLAASLAHAVREHEAQSNATPAGNVRSAASDEDAPEQARPMLALVRGLNVGFGFEKSFKLSAGNLQADRVILGVRTKLADRETVLEICQALGMPEPFRHEFEELLPESNTIGFGFEGGAYKIYLEFWDKLRHRVQRDPDNLTPELLFVGYKWAIDDPSRHALARYTCHPLLSIHGIRQQLSALYGAQAMPSLEAARQILDLAAARIPRDNSFVYVQANEEGNPRNSFDLNFYKAGLRVDDLHPILSSLCERYAIPRSQLDQLSAQSSSRPFGHLSGGIGRDGQDFLTLYYEIEAM